MKGREDTQRGDQPAARQFAALAASLDGDPGRRAPLILLHGLTFDRTMWRPALARRQRLIISTTPPPPRPPVRPGKVRPASPSPPHRDPQTGIL